MADNLDKGLDELAEPGAEEKIRKILQSPGEKPSGISSGFTSALAGLLPTVVGALFEGSRGAAVGAQVGLKAMEQVGVQQARSAKAEQDAKQFKQEQLIRGILTDEKAKRVGEPAAISPFQKESLRLREKELALRETGEARRERGQTLREKRFDFTVEEKNELSDKQLSGLTAIDQSLSQLDRIADLKLDIDTGPVMATTQAGLELVGQDDPKFAAFRAEVGDQLATFIKQMSGTAASDAEVQRLLKIVPKVSDNDEQFMSKLNVLKDRLADRKKIFVENVRIQQGKKVVDKPEISKKRARLNELRAKRARK